MAQDTLARYTPRLIQDLLRGGESKPSIDNVEGTMVFADLSGFTALSERLAAIGREGAERVTETVNRFFSAILDVTDGFGGDNLKFGGDALLLLFSGPGHADRAVQAALETRSLVRRIGKIDVEGRPVRLGMSFGVHSGTFISAVAGRPGTRMLHYMVGDESRRVAEAESEASSGQVVITPETLACLTERYAVRDHGQMHLVVRYYGDPAQPQAGRYGREVPALLGDYIAAPIREAMEKSHTGELPSEHRKAWVLFMGVEGFEQLLEESGPESAINVLADFSTAAIDRAQAHGGLVLGTDIDERGFKVIFVFGAPSAQEEDAPNAGRLALKLRDDLKQLTPALKTRIGVNSGFVFSGIVGSQHRREYTVMGDTVNLAARLMNVATHAEVVASDNFINDVGSVFLSTRRDPVSLKGKARPQENYRLEEERTDSEAGRVVTEFLGRSAEVDKLVSLSKEAAEGRSTIAAISGPIGIGKSRLLSEVESRLSADGWSVVHGPSRSHSTRTPLAPWTAVLESIAALPKSDEAARSQALAAAVAQLAPTQAEFSSLLNGVLGTRVPESAIVRGLSTEVRAERFRELVLALVAGRCKIAPTVLAFEDVHWADTASRELISECVASVRDSRLLMLITSRDAVDLPQVDVFKLQLEELDRSTSVKLLRQVLSGGGEGGGDLHTLVSRTGGNPLFIEEVGMALRASGVEKTGGLVIPDRLQTLVMSRIDALPPSERDVLRTAAVINSPIDAETISAIEPAVGPPTNVALRLDALAQMGFLDWQTGEATFRHAVVQEACYDSLAYSTRRRLHHGMVSRLESLVETGVAEMPDTLLRHSIGAGDRPRTLQYGVKAAGRARDLYAFDVAIEHYGTALVAAEVAMQDAHAVKANILEQVGECHAERGRYPDAAGSYLGSLRSWRRVSNTRTPVPEFIESSEPARLREPALLASIGQAWERASEYKKALRWIDQAIEALPARSGSLKGEIETSRSVILYRMGRYDEAITWGQRGLAAARRSGELHLLARAHNMLAMSYTEIGRLKAAIPHRENALAFYKLLDDVTGQAAANTNLGTCYQLTGKLELALEHYMIALEQSERLGNSTVVAIVNNNIGEVLLARGQFDEASDHFERAANPPVEIGGLEALRGLAEVNLCRIDRQTDKFDGGRDHIEKAISLLVHAGARGLLTEAKLEEAELQLAVGDTQDARRLASRSLGFARDSGSDLLTARAMRIVGQIERLDGNAAKAIEMLTESVAIAARCGAEHDHALGLLELARTTCETGLGSKTGAVRVLDRAIRILQSLGATHVLGTANELRVRLSA